MDARDGNAPVVAEVRVRRTCWWTLDFEILTLHVSKVQGKGVVTTGKQWTFVSYEVHRKVVYASDPLPLTEREEDVAALIGVLKSWVRVPFFLSIR